MADGKWVRGLTPETPPLEAARLVLARRFAVVVEALPKAIREGQRDPEFVHQLRVGTRRADAALRIFRCCLPRRSYRQARNRLREVRRAAGAARDWDVFLMALEERAGKAKVKERPGLDCLIGLALGQRQLAQQTLEALDPTEPFAACCQGVLDALREPDEDGACQFGDLVGPLFQKALEGLDEAASDGDLTAYEQLHQVRIAGKRLRYAIEVLVDCVPPSVHETLYPMVEQMQELLGRANDSHVAAALLTALREQLKSRPTLRDRLKPGVEALLRFHQRRVAQERKRFLKWWPSWVEAAGATGFLHLPKADE